MLQPQLVRETGTRRDSPTSLETPQRWTMSSMSTSIEAASRGCGFAWFPEYKIRGELEEGALQPLPMKEGGERFAELYLVLADREAAGPGVLRLAQIIRAEAVRACTEQGR